jgi:hypothetical protein
MWDCRKWHGKHAGFRRGGSSTSNPLRLKATRLGGARPNPGSTYLVLLVHCSISTRSGRYVHTWSVYSKHRERLGIGNLASLGSVMRPRPLPSGVRSGSGRTYPTLLWLCDLATDGCFSWRWCIFEFRCIVKFSFVRILIFLSPSC